MKILAVSDEPSPYLYDWYRPGRLKGYDLIIACGDLKKSYLEFLVTMAGCPLMYVHGNHDDSFDENPPEGCQCIDGQLVKWNGLRILGLGGSYKYRDGGHMYTEKEMTRRIRRLWPKLYFNKGFDILVTHAPARHLNDLDTLPHRGFECFNTLLDKYAPRYFLHGHIHRNYGMKIPQTTRRGDTTVINAFEYCEIDL